MRTGPSRRGKFTYEETFDKADRERRRQGRPEWQDCCRGRLGRQVSRIISSKVDARMADESCFRVVSGCFRSNRLNH